MSKVSVSPSVDLNPGGLGREDSQAAGPALSSPGAVGAPEGSAGLYDLGVDDEDPLFPVR